MSYALVALASASFTGALMLAPTDSYRGGFMIIALLAGIGAIICRANNL